MTVHRKLVFWNVIFAMVYLGIADTRAENRLSDAGSIDLYNYVYGIAYSGASSKENGYGAGIYYRAFGERNALAFELDWLRLHYDSDIIDDQWDVNLLWTNYGIKNWRLQCGAHIISSDDESVDGGITWLLGAHRYHWGQWEAGAFSAL